MKLNYKDIRDLVKKTYLSRGRDYFKKGAVKIKSDKDSCVKSEVVGTDVYQVVLKHNGQYLNGKCSCPAYKNYGPCKHMAATCFTVIHSDRKEYRKSLGYSDNIYEQANCKKLLLKKEKKDLVSIIMSFSGEHPEITEDLEDEEYGEYRNEVVVVSKADRKSEKHHQNLIY